MLWNGEAIIRSVLIASINLAGNYISIKGAQPEEMHSIVDQYEANQIYLSYIEVLVLHGFYTVDKCDGGNKFCPFVEIPKICNVIW